MSMNRRRLMLAIGAALLVGGWGAIQWSDQQGRNFPRHPDAAWLIGISQDYLPASLAREHIYSPPGRIVCGLGVVSMAVGAGLIGFAFLRPTDRKDE